MAFLRIVGLAVGAAVLYGIVHDLVTAHLCVEYFTIGHVRVVRSEDPVVLALVWGVLATWWMGVLLGVPLAIAARVGRAPKRDARALVRPTAILLLTMAGGAALSGLAGRYAAERGWIVLLGSLAQRVPAERHIAFLAVLWAHTASYAIGFAGGIAVVVRVVLARRRARRGGMG